MLTFCSSNSNVYCYNGHYEDAGVRCQGEFVMNSNIDPNGAHDTLIWQLNLREQLVPMEMFAL